MWQDIQTRLLENEIEASISFLGNETDFHSLVKEALTKSRRGLTTKTTNNKPWSLLPLIVCEAISGKYECVLPAAAALQLYIAAGDVLDDIEQSGTEIEDRIGRPVTTREAQKELLENYQAIREDELKHLKEMGVYG